jgi:hypothetical protein
MKKKRNKYKYGTKLNIETPGEALAKNDINVAKALEEGNTPMTDIMAALGGIGMQYAGGKVTGGELSILEGIGKEGLENFMAYGGQVGTTPVEVEGDEVAETPGGGLMEFKGASHEQGGIDVDLENGSKVYSDRIRIGGETLAERKKKREKSLQKIDNQLKKGFDPLLEKTSKKIKMNNEKSEAFDIQLQGLANMMANNPNSPGKLAYGTGPDPIRDIRDIMDKEMKLLPNTNLAQVKVIDYNKSNDKPYLRAPDNYADYLSRQQDVEKIKAANAEEFKNYKDNPNYLDNPQLDMYSPEIKGPGNMERDFDFTPILRGLSNLGDSVKEGAKTATEAGGKAIGESIENKPNLTGGDMVGIGSSLAQSILPLRNTLKERASDTANENYFKNFGDASMKELDDAEGAMKSVYESQVDRLAKSKRTQKAQNSLSARGVNTRRALDSSSEQQYQESLNQSVAQFQQQLIGMAQNKSQFLSKVDEMKMSGEREADLANRQDKANFYSQRGKDLMTLTEGLQSVGANLNEAEYRDTMTNMINTLYDKYGIEIDMKGNLSVDKTKSKVKKKTAKSDNEFSSRLFEMNAGVQNMNTNLKYGK